MAKMRLLSPKELADKTGISIPYVYVLERNGIIESVDEHKHLYTEGTVTDVLEYMARPRSGRLRDHLGRFEPEIEY